MNSLVKNNSKWIVFSLIGILLFVVYSIVAIRLPLSNQEQKVIGSLDKSVLTIDGKTKIFGALDEARAKLTSPLLADSTVLINKIVPDSIFALRLLGFFVFLGVLIIFYYFLRYLKIKKNLLFLPLILIGIFSFWAALRISPLIYFIFFSILALFLGLKFFREEEGDFWTIFGLIIAFLILPATYYFSLIFIFFLDLFLLTVIVFMARQKSEKIGQLLFLNLFLIIPLATWSDAYYKYFTTLHILK